MTLGVSEPEKAQIVKSVNVDHIRLGSGGCNGRRRRDVGGGTGSGGGGEASDSPAREAQRRRGGRCASNASGGDRSEPKCPDST